MHTRVHVHTHPIPTERPFLSGPALLFLIQLLLAPQTEMTFRLARKKKRCFFMQLYGTGAGPAEAEHFLAKDTPPLC